MANETWDGYETTRMEAWHDGMIRCVECCNILKIDYNSNGEINFCPCCGRIVEDGAYSDLS